ncbi:hypothetical protein MEE69_003322 [Klebsiella pneumoniae]|nr:hypothetical protein [Klebsiella pneumoniae]HEI9774308.1 hypothetical protein [Klebsiella pneumoniae]HEO9424620.1 hypothetical protein [Klebsiella pneumoniae subsp. pneumoniae]
MNHYWTCSFCGVNSLNNTTIIVRGNADEPAICSKCVSICVETLSERKGAKMDEKCIDSKVMTGEQLLVVSSQVLTILKSELSSKGLKPTSNNLRVVMGIIEKSLPDDELFL